MGAKYTSWILAKLFFKNYLIASTTGLTLRLLFKGGAYIGLVREPNVSEKTVYKMN